MTAHLKFLLVKNLNASHLSILLDPLDACFDMIIQSSKLLLNLFEQSPGDIHPRAILRLEGNVSLRVLRLWVQFNFPSTGVVNLETIDSESIVIHFPIHDTPA